MCEDRFNGFEEVASLSPKRSARDVANPSLCGHPARCPFSSLVRGNARGHDLAHEVRQQIPVGIVLVQREVPAVGLSACGHRDRLPDIRRSNEHHAGGIPAQRNVIELVGTLVRCIRSRATRSREEDGTTPGVLEITISASNL
jgi:hypothetical protein